MSKSPSIMLLAVLNVIGFIGVVVVNALANALPLAGKGTGELSDQYPNLFVPSGLTFSIWGIIYILLAIYVTYGLVQSIRMPAPGVSFMQRIGFLFLISCCANVAWIFFWHHELLPASLTTMVILLGTLAAIYLRLNVGRSAAAPTERYLVQMPMSVYFGWITVATIANVTALLVSYKWGRFGLSEQLWAIVMIGIATALVLVMLFNRNDIFYALVVDWAVVGILLKRTADSRAPAQGVIVASIVGISVISLAIIVQLLRGRVYR